MNAVTQRTRRLAAGDDMAMKRTFARGVVVAGGRCRNGRALTVLPVHRWFIYDVNGKLSEQGGAFDEREAAALAVFGPGSTLKPFVLAAAVAGGLDPQTKYTASRSPDRSRSGSLLAGRRTRAGRVGARAGEFVLGLHALGDQVRRRRPLPQACWSTSVSASACRRLMFSARWQRGVDERGQGHCRHRRRIGAGLFERLRRAAENPSGRPRGAAAGVDRMLPDRYGQDGPPVESVLSIMGKTGTGHTLDGRQLGVFVGLTPADKPTQRSSCWCATTTA
jgi:hypothetical protein